MSFSPKSFFAYFSATCQPWVILSKDRHTESSLVNLFSCKGEHRDYFDHYLDDHLSHRESRRNVGINRESSEEVLDAFKDID